MTETKPSDLIGLSELAELLGVTKGEANAMRQRHGFPHPVIKLRMGPAWDRNQVLEYHQSSIFPTSEHGFTRVVPCVDCGGCTRRIGTTMSDDSIIVHLSCQAGCGNTALTISDFWDHGNAEFKTIITVTKEA
jgi:hypothetical protein